MDESAAVVQGVLCIVNLPFVFLYDAWDLVSEPFFWWWMLEGR